MHILNTTTMIIITRITNTNIIIILIAPIIRLLFPSSCPLTHSLPVSSSPAFCLLPRTLRVATSWSAEIVTNLQKINVS